MAVHRFIQAMTEGRDIVMYGDGTQTRDFTYVDDIAGALATAGAGVGTVMNAGGDHRVSLSGSDWFRVRFGTLASGPRVQNFVSAPSKL